MREKGKQKENKEDMKQHRRKSSVGSVLTEVTQNLKERENWVNYQSVGEVQEKRKNVGKIRKNSTCSIPSTTFSQPHPIEKIQPSQPNKDKTMTKIKLSQMTNYNDSSSLFHSESLFPKKFHEQSYFNTISGKYELKMQVILGSFEVRKQKIDEQLFKIKRRKNCNIDPFDREQVRRVSQEIKEETPKFGSVMKSKKKDWEGKTNKNNGSQWQRFMSAMTKQIQLEEHLRKNKHMAQGSDKLQIASLLTKHDINSNIMNLEPQQFDPFFKPLHLSAQKIAEELQNSHQACEFHWKNEILNKFNQDLLQRIFSQLSGGKNEIFLKDFVRQLGVLSLNKKYLRNRDLFSIYKRLYPLTHQNFIKILCAHQ